MGYNTALIICNDQLHELAKDPEGGRIIQSLIQEARGKEAIYGRYGIGALQSQHADGVQIVAVGGNAIRHLGYGHYTHSPEDLLRCLADQMGYRLSKRPLRAAAKQERRGER
jgi:hypothetical protein